MTAMANVRNRSSTALRVATVVTTLLTFVFSLGVTILLWQTVAAIAALEADAKKNGREPLLQGAQKGGLYPTAFIWTVLCIISLVGLTGSSLNNRRIFSKYVTLIWAHYVLDLIIGCFAIVVVVKNDWTVVLGICTTKATQLHLNAAPCKAPLSTLRGVYIGLFFAGKLLGAGICWLASSYLYDMRMQYIAGLSLPAHHPLHKTLSGPSKRRDSDEMAIVYPFTLPPVPPLPLSAKRQKQQRIEAYAPQRRSANPSSPHWSDRFSFRNSVVRPPSAAYPPSRTQTPTGPDHEVVSPRSSMRLNVPLSPGHASPTIPYPSASRSRSPREPSWAPSWAGSSYIPEENEGRPVTPSIQVSMSGSTGASGQAPPAYSNADHPTDSGRDLEGGPRHSAVYTEKDSARKSYGGAVAM